MMSVTLTLTFPWGRYHATPWLRSNNEGAIEWPPSPWRILRALYASWKLHADDIDAATVEPLLASLCTAPTFVLPPHTEAHTRHYLPGTAHQEGVKTDTDKTLDTFVVMHPGSTVAVTWPVEVTADQRAALERLAEGVRYLGRAESIVDVAVLGESVDLPVGEKSEPGAAQGSFTLVPTGPEALASLTLTPSGVRRGGSLVPEFTDVVAYPTERPLAQRVNAAVVKERSVTAVRLTLSNNVLPSRFDAVVLGDVVHRAAVLIATKSGGTVSTHLTGKQPDGKSALDQNHQHVHYLSVPGLSDLQGRRVESVVAWAPGGLSGDDLNALTRLKRVSSRRLKGELRLDVVLTDSGLVEDVAPELSRASQTWVSVTPYAPVLRHKGALEEQLHQDIARELGFRGIAIPFTVNTSGNLSDGPWLQYRRYRPGKETIRRGRPAFGVTLTFEEPVQGPIAIGQLSHFGLGLFRPV